MNGLAASGITIGDVLRLVLPLNTKVVGDAGSGRLVNWLAVLTEFSHLSDQVQGGDIVILPPGLQNGVKDSAIAEVLIFMAELPAAALVVFHPISDNLVRISRAHELPILLIRGDTTLREVHQGIAGLLADRQNQINERGIQLYRRLTEMSREGQGLGAMTEVMSRLTGKIVAVQDKRLEFRALTVTGDSGIDEPAVLSALGKTGTLPAVLRNRKAAASLRQSHWQQLLPIGDLNMARLICPIISGDRARGYVSVIGAPDELDLLDKLTTEYGAAACALEMAKAKAISETKKSLRGNFLEGLLAGRLPDSEISRLASRLDHDTGHRHAILTLAWDGKEAPTLRRLETPTHWLLSTHNRPALTHIFGDEHVCVFQALDDNDEDMSTAVDFERRLRDHLRAEFPGARLLAGLSGPAQTLSDWPLAHTQAVQAMELGKRLRLDTVVEYESLGIYQLLAQLDDSPVIQRFCEEIVGPLVRYDERHRSNLLDTISAYFEHHGNVSQTAEALFIHRNTLVYRLDRIQELTGQDLDSADMRLSMHLALKLWQLR
jgi:purine catabolism regulator